MSSRKAKTYVDKNGYERYSDTHRLVHRDVAYYQIYKKNRHFYPLRFRVYQVHHRDGNKRNNLSPRWENRDFFQPEAGRTFTKGEDFPNSVGVDETCGNSASPAPKRLTKPCW